MNEKTEKSEFWAVPLGLLAILSISAFNVTSPLETGGTINPGDTAWMLAATGLVLLMTPGLAFFYGGMVSRKNIISTMFQCSLAMGVITALWIIVGFSLAFGSSIGGIIGSPIDYMMFDDVGTLPKAEFADTIPFLLFALFQLKFAIITPALIAGAFAERIRFSAFMLFISIWSLLVYCPLAHWTWHPQGFLRELGVLDFAGGTVVHMSAGFAALAGALFLGKRKNHGTHSQPANIPYIMLGTGLLWFGWFGFNAGSALKANDVAVLAFFNTNTASAVAMLSWISADVLRGKRPSLVGACIGAVVGLVAITPAAGYVNYSAAIFIGTFSALASHYAVALRSKTGLDDTLDVFPCHGIGGIFGMFATAIFASQGGLLTGETKLFIAHTLAFFIVGIYVFTVSYLIYWITDAIIPMRVSEAEEEQGLDFSQHEEIFGELSGHIHGIPELHTH